MIYEVKIIIREISYYIIVINWFRKDCRGLSVLNSRIIIEFGRII